MEPRNQVPEEGSETEKGLQQVPDQVINIQANTILLWDFQEYPVHLHKNFANLCKR